MTEPIINQVNNIAKIDDTSDIAGAAAVTPNYIVADVQTAPEVNASVGIDNIEVSNGVSTSQVSLGGAVEKEESSNYILSDVPSDALDGYDMNSIHEISGAGKYVDYSAPEVQLILASLKENGVINSGMSEEEMIIAINKYVGRAYSYIADAGDHWNTVSETIKIGGGDCEDLANLEASLITAALMDRGLSLEEISKKINCVVVMNNSSLMGHVYVQYTQEDGSIKYLDPVFSTVTSSISSSMSVLFSYGSEGVNIINGGYDYTKLATADYTVSEATSTFTEITDFKAYWENRLLMEENFQEVIDVLNGLINAINWDSYDESTKSYKAIIENFISALQSCHIQDKATMDGFLSQLSALYVKFNNALPGLQSEIDRCQSAVDTAQAAYDLANATYIAAYNNFNNYVNKYGWGYKYCPINSGIFGLTDTSGWYFMGGTPCYGIVYNEYIQKGISDLSSFRLKHPEYNSKSDAYILDNVYFGYTGYSRYIDFGLPDYSSAYTVNVCTVREGLAGIQAYIAYQKAAAGALDPTTSANLQAAKNARDTANANYNAEVACRNKAQETNNLILSAPYYGYSVAYSNSFSLTTSYINSMLSSMGAAEYRAWELNMEVCQINDIATLLSAQAEMDDAYTTYKTYIDKYGSFNIETYLIPWEYEMRGISTLADCQRIYPGVTLDGWWFINDINGAWVCTVREGLNAIQAYITYDDARDDLKELKAQFMETYNISSDKLTALINEFQAKYLTQDPKTGWWSINFTDTDFDPYKADSKINEAKAIKGYLTALSIIYEAKRDIRDLVEQELEGESDGLKGMKINKLFMTKVDKAQGLIEETISDILSAMNSYNQANQTDLISDINTKYEELENEEQNNTPGTCEDDDREENILKLENQRLAAVNAVESQYEAIEEKNLTIAKNMLASIGVNITGTTGDEIWDSITKEIGNAVNSLDSLERYTLSTTDDSQYTEVDTTLAISVRDRLIGAVNLRRVALMAQQAVSDMRNLVHKEMTGIGGREANTDAAAEIVADDEEQVSTWFNEAVTAIEEKVSLSNQIRYNKIQIEKNQAMIDEIESQKGKSFWSKVCEGIAFVAAVGAAVFTGGASLVLLVVALGAGYVGGILSASRNKEIADKRAELEETLGKLQVIVPTEEEYTIQDVTVSGSEDDYTGDLEQNVFNTILNLAGSSESSTQDILYNMTGSNYLTKLGDSYGTTAFDTIKFASSMEGIRNNNLKVLVAETARRTIAEMRNLVHMEMTSVGGRAPSNMTTYAMEAARGQLAFVSNEMYTKIYDLNTANNLRADWQKKKELYEAMADAADTSYDLSFIPIVGSIAGSEYESITDLYAQRDSYNEIAKEDLTTGYSLSESDLNALITDALLDTGDGTTGVDYDKIADVRSAKTKEYIANSVQSSIMKVLRQLRSLTHMEMTNIQSSSGQDFGEQAIGISFSSAMDSLTLISNYLSQKAQIMNNVNEANNKIDLLNSQIRSAWTGLGAAVAGFAITCALMGFGGGFWAIVGTLQLASSVANAILAISRTVNAWYTANYEENRAEDDMGEIADYLQIQDIMEESVNSTTSRLEALEQECIEEINAGLIEDLGSGFIGVNRGLSAKYKSLIDQLYKEEKRKSDVQQTLQELRNAVHQIMSGMSGVTINSTNAVINMRKQDIKARIDDMFSKLEVAVERWNDISEAKLAAERAKLEAEMQTVTTMITVVIVTLECIAAAKSSSAKQDAQTAETNLNNAQTAYKNDPSATNATLVNDNEVALNTANAKVSDIQKPYMMWSNVYLPALQIVVKLAFAYATKSAVKNAQKAREGQVTASGATTSAKDSSVVNREGLVAGGFSSYSATQQAKFGQSGLKTQAAQYALKGLEIENEFNDDLYNVQEEAFEFVKGTAESKLKEWIKEWKVNKKQQGYQKNSPESSELAVPAASKLTAKQMKELQTQLSKATTPAEFMAVAQKMVNIMNTNANVMRADNFKPQEHVQSNNKVLAQSLDKLLTQIAETIATTPENAPVGAAQTEAGVPVQAQNNVVEQPAVSKADLKKVLDQLKVQLKQVNADLSKAKAEVQSLKAKIQEVQGELGKLGARIEKELKTLLDGLDELQGKLNKLQELAGKLDKMDKNDPAYKAQKAQVDKMMADIKGKIEAKTKEYQKLLEDKHRLEGGQAELESEVKAAEEKVAALTSQKAKIMNDIVNVRKELERQNSQEKGGEQEKGQDQQQERSKGRQAKYNGGKQQNGQIVNNVTPMFAKQTTA